MEGGAMNASFANSSFAEYEVPLMRGANETLLNGTTHFVTGGGNFSLWGGVNSGGEDDEYEGGGWGWGESQYPSGYSHLGIVLTSFFVTVIMIVIVVGNMLVCIAIATEKALKQVQNWFIASLAVSDFLVGLVIMPFSLAKEVMGYWIFGSLWCDIHSALDVFLCTASINSLCLISLDRYWSVTQAVEYLRKRTAKRSMAMICGVWVLSAVISLPPLVGWKKQQRPNAAYPECLLSDDVGYVLYSAFGSFYVPAFVMVFVYCRIFVAARSRARRHLKKRHKGGVTPDATTTCNTRSTTTCTTSFSNASPPPPPRGERNGGSALPPPPPIVVIEEMEEDANSDSVKVAPPPRRFSMLRAPKFLRSPFGSTLSLADMGGSEEDVSDDSAATKKQKKKKNQKLAVVPDVVVPPPSPQPPTTEAERQRRRIAKARERRATLILGLIMASFILAWLPFFVLYVLEALCSACHIGATGFAVAFWLGYCNSALNPIIYTIFNRDFRRAFRKILFKRRRTRVHAVQPMCITSIPNDERRTMSISELEASTHSLRYDSHREDSKRTTATKALYTYPFPDQGALGCEAYVSVKWSTSEMILSRFKRRATTEVETTDGDVPKVSWTRWTIDYRGLSGCESYSSSCS
ncbi:hypothetical protein JTE90_018728 [Oedothorax gibbosus]|uniref:G-protein coupled receptors family 1 profile domain-containing protein n=1 Tax=Oedothorax gibbosus TaxID=931172 RepID=A0AAV6UJN4_9ARAC|nr:hypothetical protein JTE90_018728 [Oedothorax gibbosus]